MEDTMKMKILRAAVLGVAAIALSGGAAQAATITTSLFTPQTLTGTVIPVLYSGATGTTLNPAITTTPFSTGFSGTGYSVSFSGVPSNEGVIQGTTVGVDAEPVANAAGAYPLGGYGSGTTASLAAAADYFSTGLGTITLTFTSPVNSLELLWGSVDSTNSLSLHDVGGATETVTGAQLQTAIPTLGNGVETAGGSVYVLVTSTNPSGFSSVTFTSTVVSFEFADVAAAVATPEPSGLALFGFGIALIGIGAFNRKRRTAAAVHA